MQLSPILDTRGQDPPASARPGKFAHVVASRLKQSGLTDWKRIEHEMVGNEEDLQAALNLAQRFQQLQVRKSPSKIRGDQMGGFKKFLLRGNVVDMAVGIVVGAAFGTVVSAFVKDLLTPFIAAVVKQPDFSRISFSMNGSKFLVGDFINELVSFILVAAAVYFAVVLPMNKLLLRLQSPSAPTTKQCPECLSEVPTMAKRCAHCTSPLGAIA
jgi:large conductance mechanosensitive channel